MHSLLINQLDYEFVGDICGVYHHVYMTMLYDEPLYGACMLCILFIVDDSAITCTHLPVDLGHY